MSRIWQELRLLESPLQNGREHTHPRSSNLILTPFHKTPMALSGVGSSIRSSSCRRSEPTNLSRTQRKRRSFPRSRLLGAAHLRGRPNFAFQLKLDCCISISGCGTFTREHWIFIPTDPVKCAPSTRFDAVAAMRASAASIFCEPGPAIRCRALIPTQSEQSTRGLQTPAAMFAHLGSSRSIVLCYRPDPRQTNR